MESVLQIPLFPAYQPPEDKNPLAQPRYIVNGMLSNTFTYQDPDENVGSIGPIKETIKIKIRFPPRSDLNFANNNWQAVIYPKEKRFAIVHYRVDEIPDYAEDLDTLTVYDQSGNISQVTHYQPHLDKAEAKSLVHDLETNRDRAREVAGQGLLSISPWALPSLGMMFLLIFMVVILGLLAGTSTRRIMTFKDISAVAGAKV